MTLGQPLLGTDYGPKLLREKGLTSEITNLDWRVSDSGDLQFPSPSGNDPQLDSKLGKAKNCYPVGLGNKQIFEAAYESHQNQMFTLVIGGDHSVAFGTVAAAIKCNPDVGVVWVDAHADLNTPLTSPSGNMHGMPLGLLMGLCDPASIPGFEWMQEVPQLKPEQLSYIGLRDVDKGEAKAIRDLGIQAFTMHDIDRYGIGGVVNQVLKNQGDRPLHLSYDIDAVDPIEAPSTGTVVRGGLTFREAHFVAEAISDTGNLKSMDIVEVNPQLEPGEGANMTADMGLQLTLSAMGTRIL
jgi:arginase